MVHKQRHTGQSPNPELYEYLYNTDIPEGVEVALSSVSERDSVWDAHRTNSAMVDMVYSYNSEFERYSERISDCSGYLKFGIGKQGLVLKQAFFAKYDTALYASGVNRFTGRLSCTNLFQA